MSLPRKSYWDLFIFCEGKLKAKCQLCHLKISFFFWGGDIFIDYAITVVPFPPLHSTPSCPPPPSHIPPL